jgi:uncharacterized protein
MLVFFHDDLDGKTAAAVILKAFPGAKTIAMDYDRPFPVDMIEKGENVVLVDFTPNKPEEFKEIVSRSDQVVWLDHHGANIKKYKSLDERLQGIRVESEPSGAMLAWQYYFEGIPAPRVVELVSDYDCWLHEIPNDREFFWGTYLIDHAPESPIWHQLLEPSGDIGDAIGQSNGADEIIEYCIRAGNVIIPYRRATQSETLRRFGYTTEFEGLKAIACCTSERGSDIFNLMLDEVDIAISYCHDGEKFTFGVYSRKDEVNCAEICKKHGGGGHKGAAGFSAKELPFKKGDSLRG